MKCVVCVTLRVASLTSCKVALDKVRNTFTAPNLTLGSRLPYSTDSYFHPLAFVFVITNIKVTFEDARTR